MFLDTYKIIFGRLERHLRRQYKKVLFVTYRTAFGPVQYGKNKFCVSLGLSLKKSKIFCLGLELFLKNRVFVWS